MKPRDIVHALERLEMELEGERMAREDVAGQYMRYVEAQKQHADSTTAFETDALKHELARVQSENRSLRKKIMQICNAGRSAPTVVQNLLKASLKRPSEAAEGNVPAEQEDRPADHAHRGECAKKSRAEAREHTEIAQPPVRLEEPFASGPQRQARHEGGWEVPSIKVETAVDGAGQEQPPPRKREGGANVRRGAKARDFGRPIAGDIPLAPTANTKSPEQPQEAAGTRGALKDIRNQPMEARRRGFSAAGDVASGKETEAVKPESASPPVQEAKWTKRSTPPDEAWGLDDLGERSPGGRYPGERVYNEAVRNRDQRAAMPGHACHCCTNFLNAVHEDTAERQRIIQQCSKHRQYRRRYETPPQYWELEFLDEL